MEVWFLCQFIPQLKQWVFLARIYKRNQYKNEPQSLNISITLKAIKMNKNKKIESIYILFTLIFIGFGINAGSNFNQHSIDNLPSNEMTLGLKIYGIDCISTTGFFEGRKTEAHKGIDEIVECDDNILFNEGKNMTRNYLSLGGGGAITTIQLCNSTGANNCSEPSANHGDDRYVPYTTCGLAATTGTVLNNIGIGNWSISKTFTATCDGLQVNVTRLQNATPYNFSGNSFVPVTLQTNDQITVNHTTVVS